MENSKKEWKQCYYCNYECTRPSHWERHLSSVRHKKCIQKDMDIYDLKENKNTCDICNKKYKTSSGLWYHQQKCKQQANEVIAQPIQETSSSEKELLMLILKDNLEFKKMLTEFVIHNNNGSITNNTNNVNSHNTTNNNQFNLNFFLNEQCKDAININDFINSIDISFDDLEHTAKNGYVDGITNIIVQNLRELDTYKRPIHCSDVKRGTLYFKHNDKWEKDLEEKPIARQVVRAVGAKNIGKIQDWIQANPGCQQSDSIKNNMYHKILDNAMSGDSQEIQSNNVDRVIRNITKAVAINKTFLH